MNKGHSPIYSHDCGMNRTFLFLKIENGPVMTIKHCKYVVKTIFVAYDKCNDFRKRFRKSLHKLNLSK